MILNIGNELLIGQVVNTNAAYIAKTLNLYGIKVDLIEVVADDENEILQALQKGQNYNVVIITGGLGPTKDDITKNTLAKFLEDEFITDEVVLKDLENLVKSRKREMNELNKQQAKVLSKAKIIRNFLGTAPGMILKKNNTIYVSLPGVPYEMKPMLNEAIKEILKTYNKEEILHKSILVFGIPESELAIKIEAVENELSANGLQLAYLPNRNLIRLRLSAYGIPNAQNQIQQYIHKLKDILGHYVVGEENENEITDYPLARAVVEKLKQLQLTVAFAESCTGGAISSMITKVPGASEVLKGSVVSYSNEVKIKTLGVKPNTIQQYGAVSEACVIEMVTGVQKMMQTDMALAVSGIAGPSGGTKEKPIGTVWMALSFNGSIDTKLFQLGTESTREYIIESATFYALAWILKKLISP